jgi:isocitrate dehydrogenase (NAD+)
MRYSVTELLGDGIGVELSQAIHTMAQALPINLDFIQVDLSLENRRREGPQVYDRAYKAITETRFALKYPTMTEEESPNVVLRKLCNFSAIHRPVMTLPGVKSNFTKKLDLDIVRVATGGTYEDPGRLIGSDVAVSLRIVERPTTQAAAVFAFELAKKTHKSVTSASKYTIQRATDGLFEDIVARMEKQYPGVPHKKELFDALLAKIIMHPEDFQVILVLNEYGDFLSDMACGLVGSMGIGASGSYAFDEKGYITLGMFDPAGGTAPDIAGKNKANPTAMFLAFSQLLFQLGEATLATLIRESTLSLLEKGNTTPDLGGQLGTMEFTQEVIVEIKRRLTL